MARKVKPATDFPISEGDIDVPYEVKAAVEARVTSKTVFNSKKTFDDVYPKLIEAAIRAGGNAVINVEYERGISGSSWKALTARGTAVLADFGGDMTSCPFCAEPIKAAAVKCKHCGADIAPSPDATAEASDG
jgi:hypothetical protein